MSKLALIATMAAALTFGGTSAYADCKVMHETKQGDTLVCGSNGVAKYTVEFWKIPGKKKEHIVTRLPIDDEIKWFRKQYKEQ